MIISAYSLIGTASCVTKEHTCHGQISVMLAHLVHFYCGGTYSVLCVSAVCVYIYIVTIGYLALYLHYVSAVRQCWLPGGG